MNCPHHLMWIIPVRQGLHQCIQCWQVVGRKDVASKFEDLPPAFQQRWEEHEKEGQLAAPAAPRTTTPAPEAPPRAQATAAPREAPARSPPPLTPTSPLPEGPATPVTGPLAAPGDGEP